MLPEGSLEKMELEQTYANALTSTVTIPAKIPLIMSNDLLAIKAGIKPATGVMNKELELSVLKTH